eukprot:1140771-Pelagomonas_calceolata.AAC.4
MEVFMCACLYRVKMEVSRHRPVHAYVRMGSHKFSPDSALALDRKHAGPQEAHSTDAAQWTAQFGDQAVPVKHMLLSMLHALYEGNHSCVHAPGVVCPTQPPAEEGQRQLHGGPGRCKDRGEVRGAGVRVSAKREDGVNQIAGE